MELVIISGSVGLVVGIAVGRGWRRQLDSAWIDELRSALVYERSLSATRLDTIIRQRSGIDVSFWQRTIASRFIDVREDWS